MRLQKSLIFVQTEPGWTWHRVILLMFTFSFRFKLLSFGLFYDLLSKNLWITVVEEWADLTGVEHPTYYERLSQAKRSPEPRGVFHPSQELSVDVTLDSDWLKKLKGFSVHDYDRLTKYEGFSCSFLIGCREFFGFGHKPCVFGNVLR